MSYHCLLRRWLPLEHVCSRQPLATGVLGRLHFLNYPFRSSLKRSSLNQWFAERKKGKITHRSLSIFEY
jgi:hypothetical protein